MKNNPRLSSFGAWAEWVSTVPTWKKWHSQRSFMDELTLIGKLFSMQVASWVNLAPTTLPIITMPMKNVRAGQFSTWTRQWNFLCCVNWFYLKHSRWTQKPEQFRAQQKWKKESKTNNRMEPSKENVWVTRARGVETFNCAAVLFLCFCESLVTTFEK